MDIPPPFNAVWFQFTIGLLVGASVGSFLTMLAYRLPRHMSIIEPGSHCPTCQSQLGIKDLVPIFSWLTSAGHCRHCKASIGVRYVWIEIASAFSGGILFIIIGHIWS